MTISLHSKTWKGKMAAGAKKLGLPFGKKTPDDSISLQTTATVPESSYTYKKPEGSTLMLLEEESSQTEAMKYASEVQHQEQSKESGSNQMPGAMWEAAVAAQIVQTLEVPGQQTSTASGPGESPFMGGRGMTMEGGPRDTTGNSPEPRILGPGSLTSSASWLSWYSADRTRRVYGIDTPQCYSLPIPSSNRYIPDPPIQPDPSKIAEWEREHHAPAREGIITIADLRNLADTATARISPVKSTSSIGRTLDTITEGENPIPLQSPGTRVPTPYYANNDPWGDHPHTDSPQPER
ncbi:uncharacterized protein EV420DRAFT_1484339 [Desarmillaria tabescens]|uniref:Uncharacterized protein n=1 Tax=Armillaria tabescens TaxID=1929756 RepID=A0AA39JMB5_ARMTA|nr:uncharacterized protein EV420DRAFT_1484339 [Desarmillaria tabescens]KAK0445283.1 hypothetical protein EV420DRAFT_1484339 [Desarmillaria tabescens]